MSHDQWQWACSITTAEDILRRSEGKQKMYKSSGQKQKYILPLTLTLVSLKSMCFHTATYRSFLSFCDREGRQRSIPSGPFWQIEWREYNLLFLEGLPCGKRVRPFPIDDTEVMYHCLLLIFHYTLLTSNILHDQFLWIYSTLHL